MLDRLLEISGSPWLFVGPTMGTMAGLVMGVVLALARGSGGSITEVAVLGLVGLVLGSTAGYVMMLFAFTLPGGPVLVPIAAITGAVVTGSITLEIEWWNRRWAAVVGFVTGGLAASLVACLGNQ